MPDDHARYYGFTRFAIELNEITPALREKLPITDTRYILRAIDSNNKNI
jgi:hypothetical protein